MKIAVVVTWKNNGTRHPCGQTVGADGSGNFAKVYLGDDVIKGDTMARKFIDRLVSNQEYPGQIEIKSVIHSDGSSIEKEYI